MGQIAILAQEVASQVQAHWLIERPAQAIKELVENALDAEASQVTVKVHANPLEYLEVVDNGRGIDPDDFPHLGKIFSTSKINHIKDLVNLKTYGFRGLALHFLTQVSQATIVSNISSDASKAWRKQWLWGKVIEPASATYHPKGTTVRLEKLFENDPLKRQFLRSSSVEIARIRQIVKSFLISHPHVTWVCEIGGNRVWELPAQSMISRISWALGQDEIFFLEEPFDGGAFQIYYWMSNPLIKANNNQSIWIFVNKRWVSDRNLQYAIIQGYRGYLMNHEYPIGVLWIESDGHFVDVNVSSDKTQVRFKDPDRVFNAVIKHIRDVLQKTNWNPASKWSISPPNPELPEKSNNFSLGLSESLELKHKSDPNDKSQQGNIQQILFQESEQIDNFDPILEANLESCQILGQWQLTYILVGSPFGLIIVDQHAAHERILFEELLAKSRQRSWIWQPLLDPIFLDIPSGWLSHDPDKIKRLNHFGIQAEQVGPQTLGIYQVAQGISLQEQISWLKTLLGLSAFWQAESQWEAYLHEWFAKQACHTAIKAGDRLTQGQMYNLLKRLVELKQSHFCPHGRPVSIIVRLTEVEKRFGRVV